MDSKADPCKTESFSDETYLLDTVEYRLGQQFDGLVQLNEDIDTIPAALCQDGSAKTFALITYSGSGDPAVEQFESLAAVCGAAASDSPPYCSEFPVSPGSGANPEPNTIDLPEPPELCDEFSPIVRKFFEQIRPGAEITVDSEKHVSVYEGSLSSECFFQEAWQDYPDTTHVADVGIKVAQMTPSSLNGICFEPASTRFDTTDPRWTNLTRELGTDSPSVICKGTRGDIDHQAVVLNTANGYVIQLQIGGATFTDEDDFEPALQELLLEFVSR